jgi:hypothetical protein
MFYLYVPIYRGRVDLENESFGLQNLRMYILSAFFLGDFVYFGHHCKLLLSRMSVEGLLTTQPILEH